MVYIFKFSATLDILPQIAVNKTVTVSGVGFMKIRVT